MSMNIRGRKVVVYGRGGEENSLAPKYNIEKLFKASKGTSKIKVVRTVIGTVKRIIKGSI